MSEKFPSLQLIHNQILSNLEANCFYNSKKGKIKEATAIVNLKSNYGWTDRQQVAVDARIDDGPDISKLTEAELTQFAELSRKIRE